MAASPLERRCQTPMKVQVNSDKEVSADSEFRNFARENVGRTLQRFENRLTRVEVYLSDVNSAKPGPLDKLCTLEARPARRKPVSVTQTASTAEEALQGAARKMQRRLATSLGKSETQGLRKLRSRKAESVASPITGRRPGKTRAGQKTAARRAPAHRTTPAKTRSVGKSTKKDHQ
jgi:hypothetical protein